MYLKAFSSGTTGAFVGFDEKDELVWLGLYGLGMDGRPFCVTGAAVENEAGNFRLYSRAAAASSSFPNPNDPVSHHVGHCTAKVIERGDVLTLSYAFDTIEFGFNTVDHFSPMPERFVTGALNFGRLV